MKLSAAIATFIAVALAAPAKDAAKLDKRATTWIYLCNDDGSNGTCRHIPAEAGLCVGLDSDLNDQVSSAGADPGTKCFLFRDYNCSGPGFQIGHPGIKKLQDVGFNDQASSYFCINA